MRLVYVLERETADGLLIAVDKDHPATMIATSFDGRHTDSLRRLSDSLFSF